MPISNFLTQKQDTNSYKFARTNTKHDRSCVAHDDMGVTNKFNNQSWIET